MEEELFKPNFPAFPCSDTDIQKLGVLVRGKKLMEKEAWDKLRAEKPKAVDTVAALAALPQVKPRDLAQLEADILNLPFIALEEQDISSDVLKLFKPENMAEFEAVPIRITGQELLVGMLSPGDTELLKKVQALTTLALRPAKVLREPVDKRIAQVSDAKKAATVKKGPRKRLGDILIDMKLLTEEQMKGALEESKAAKLRLGTHLVKKGLVSNKQLSIALSKQFDIPFVDLEESLVDPVLATLLPKKLCYESILCPVKKEGSKIVIALTDPTDIITIDHVEMMTGLRVSPVVSSELSIMSALDKLYGESIDSLGQQIGVDEGAAGAGEDGLEDLAENDSAIVKLVSLIITQAAQTGVSDIHIEPFETDLRVRYRKDGMLKMFMSPNKAAAPGIASRIKVLSNLDIAETRLPQDGRIKMSLGDRRVDLRVSTVPVAWGEKICMRLLDQGNLKVNLQDLGFEPHVLELFMEGVKQPNGIVLVTGPTGSGKTTTLYSSLHLLNNPGVNIMTAEDPVEYNLVGINQVQCHADIGLDFGAALRSFLRQDPNIIMIGEIRDFETASIAVKAAMTGHLVISTLHTNDAPSTIGRLLQMGLEPFALTTSVRVVEAQRLVRRICKSCYTEFKASVDQLKTLGVNERLIERLRLKDIDLNNVIIAKGAGCQDCDMSGYRGRQGIYEVLAMSAKFRELVENKGSPEEMRKQAIADGMLTLRESALNKLLTKRTTMDEVMRVTLDAPDDKPAKKSFKPAGAAAPAAGAPGGSVSVAELGGMSAEIKAFRSSLERLAGGGPAATVSLEGAALKANITDPLDQIQAQIQAGMTGKADLGKLLPAMHAQGEKMDFNLKNLVHHFSTPTLSPARFNIQDLVERDLVAGLKGHVILSRLLSGIPSIGQGLKLTKNYGAGLPPVVFDPALFRQIVVNLATNALMALPKGGEIKVITRLKPGTTNRIELAILDTGIGISPDAQGKLFSPFTPVGRKTLGLGLSVVKKLMELGGGAISIKSQPGANTLVLLEFPAAT